jgi:hypothetical protein
MTRRFVLVVFLALVREDEDERGYMEGRERK